MEDMCDLKFCVTVTVHVLVISILSDKCTSSYNTRGMHKLLHISVPRCNHQGVITANVDKPTVYVLFVLVKII